MTKAYIITTETISVPTLFELAEHNYIGNFIEITEDDLKLFELLMSCAGKYEKSTRHYKDGENGLYLTTLDCIHNSTLLRKCLKQS